MARLELTGRWWRRGLAAKLRDELSDCRRRRDRSGRRLAHMDAKLQVIDRTELARAAWIIQAREVLARGLAAIQVLAEREQQGRGSQQVASAAGRVNVEDRVRLGAAGS